MSILHKVKDLFLPRSTDKVDLKPDLTKKNEALYAELKRQLGSKTYYYPGSEGDSPIFVVRFGWWKIYSTKRFPRQKDGAEQHYLDAMMGSKDKEVARIGLSLMTQDKLISISLPGRTPASRDVYVLAFFGTYYTGVLIKNIIET